MKKLIISSVALLFMAVAPSFAAPRVVAPYNSAAHVTTTAKKNKKKTMKKTMKKTSSKSSTKSATAKTKKKS